MRVPLGEWVVIKTIWGAWLIGYVEEYRKQYCIVRTANGYQECGRIENAYPAAIVLDDEDIRYMKELALTTWDEEWFDYLCEKQKGMIV